MNKESIKNRRLVATLIVVALLVLSAGADLLNLKVNKLESERNYFLDKFNDTFNNNDLTEAIIKGSDVNNRIMVVNVNGVIAGGSGYGGYDHNALLQGLENAKEDKTIKGIMFNVDSPGGTVYHSAEAWNKIMELKEVRKDIKIYTSMGTVAASGGYYIAAPSDKIFASEETVTGSIGVIADYVNYAGLEEKFGIKHNVMKSADHKDIGSATREMTPEEREIIQNSIMESYEKFLDVVSKGRNIPKDKLRPIADGRTYSGSQAVKNKLVDEIGYYDDALDALTNDLKLKDPEVFEVATSSSIDLFSSLFGVELQSLINRNPNELDMLKDIRKIYGVNNSPNMMYILGGY